MHCLTFYDRTLVHILDWVVKVSKYAVFQGIKSYAVFQGIKSYAVFGDRTSVADLITSWIPQTTIRHAEVKSYLLAPDFTGICELWSE